MTFMISLAACSMFGPGFTSIRSPEDALAEIRKNPNPWSTKMDCQYYESESEQDTCSIPDTAMGIGSIQAKTYEFHYESRRATQLTLHFKGCAGVRDELQAVFGGAAPDGETWSTPSLKARYDGFDSDYCSVAFWLP